MPRAHTSLRQKNKPFKGKKTSQKNQPKTAKTTKTKRIGKSSGRRVKNSRQQLLQDRKAAKTNRIQNLTAKNDYLDTGSKSIIKQQLKQENEIKVVLLLPCNSDVKTSVILQQIFGLVNNKSFVCKVNPPGVCCPSLQIFPVESKTFIRSNLHILSPQRDLQSLQDLAKISDIICPILSCKSTNTQGIDLDPHQQGRAFDEVGYVTMNILRSLGLPTTIGIIQHMETHQPKHHDKISKLFKRFFSSELGDAAKCVNFTGKDLDSNKLLRLMDSSHVDRQRWKAQRGYLIIDNIVSSNEETLVVEGFLKGNCIHANQLVHATGFNDYQLQKIQIKTHPSKKRYNNSSTIEEQANLIQYATSSESLYPFSKKQNQTAELDLINALQSLKIQQQNLRDNPPLQMDEDQYEDVESEGGEMSFDDNDLDFNEKAEEKAKRIQMQMRKEDELQFQDQVQYTGDDILREKYKEFQGLKSFKTTVWNHLENLPDQYDRIYNFKNYTKTTNNVIEQNLAKAFAYPGFYVRITVKKFPVHELPNHLKRFPLIFTFMHTHQRKMTILHAKVRRNPYYPSNDTKIESNRKYMISLGFRRFEVKPMFSRCVNGTQKTKFTKKIQQDYESYFYCSFYYYNYFPPAPVLIFSYSMDSLEASPIMYGTLAKCDPMHVILERIILTGYPYKINKRRSTVRFMFFNPKDVKYFRPIEVRSKLGLRGKIEQSLGTHGLMKCLFNDRIKHNDTVCMHLYRRVYPPSPF